MATNVLDLQKVLQRDYGIVQISDLAQGQGTRGPQTVYLGDRY
jgi:hypothetical protein